MRGIPTRLTARSVAIAATTGLILAGAPARAVLVAADDFGGFSSSATASPLRLEIFEQAVPIPTEPDKPQLEFDFSYTRVLADSGPSATARASALWPGPALGDGLKTFGEQLGLPDVLVANGYPVQVNSAFPGDTTQQSDEPAPGMVQRVNATGKRAVAQAGYGTDVTEGTTSAPAAASTDPLAALLGGDISALGGILGGKESGNADTPATASPFGALSALIGVEGMSSVSSTEYTTDTATATATSKIGQLRLLGGLITFDGVEVVTKVVSTLEGAEPSRSVRLGGMTIMGQKVGFGPDGIQAPGNTIAIPGLPSDPGKAMEALGFSFEMPQPTVVKDGTSASVDADALRITLDTKPLLGMLPKLPWDAIFAPVLDAIPLPAQLNMIKGMLPALLGMTPKIVVHVGSATAAAATIAPMDFDDEGGSADGTAGAGTDPGGDAGTDAIAGTGGGADAGAPGAGAPVDAGAPVTGEATTVDPMAAIPGLPPLGSVPMLLTLLGLLLAAGVGRYLGRAGGLIFAAGTACGHGLKSGVPDLRKV